MLYAKVMGCQYVAGGTSWNVCKVCAGKIRSEGGMIMGTVYHGDGTKTTRQRSFERPS